jgi:hypothetical protein
MLDDNIMGYANVAILEYILMYNVLYVVPYRCSIYKTIFSISNLCVYLTYIYILYLYIVSLSAGSLLDYKLLNPIPNLSFILSILSMKIIYR